MNTQSIPLYVGLLIHFGVPLAGVATFLWFRNKIASDKELQVMFFLLFAHYGALLVLLLTIPFWYWSGMASIGSVYLISVGTLVMTVIACVGFYHRKLSLYYRVAFIAAGVYILLMICVIGAAFLHNNALRQSPASTYGPRRATDSGF